MKPETLLQAAKDMQETIIRQRRYLHTHPGTGFDIAETKDFVKKELEDMIHDGETIEVGCQFCNKKYPVTVEELKSLLARSRR